MRDRSQVVRRTPGDTPVPLYTRTFPLPNFPRFYFTAIRLFFFASRCGISGDSRPAILGIVRFAIRDSVQHGKIYRELLPSSLRRALVQGSGAQKKNTAFSSARPHPPALKGRRSGAVRCLALAANPWKSASNCSIHEKISFPCDLDFLAPLASFWAHFGVSVEVLVEERGAK